MGGIRDTFEVAGQKQERVKKIEEGKEKEDEKINYQMMKSKKYKYENKGGSLNEKGKKEKGKHEISQKQKHDKKGKEEKVTIKESYTESNLEKEYVALEPEKNEMIQQTENKEQNWKEYEKDKRDLGSTHKREKEHMMRAVIIEKQEKGNLRQNGKYKDAEKRSEDKLKCKN